MWLSKLNSLLKLSCGQPGQRATTYSVCLLFAQGQRTGRRPSPSGQICSWLWMEYVVCWNFSHVFSHDPLYTLVFPNQRWVIAVWRLSARTPTCAHFPHGVSGCPSLSRPLQASLSLTVAATSPTSVICRLDEHVFLAAPKQVKRVTQRDMTLPPRWPSTGNSLWVQFLGQPSYWANSCSSRSLFSDNLRNSSHPEVL